MTNRWRKGEEPSAKKRKPSRKVPGGEGICPKGERTQASWPRRPGAAGVTKSEKGRGEGTCTKLSAR